MHSCILLEEDHRGSNLGEKIKPTTRFYFIFLLANVCPEYICKCFSLYCAIDPMLFPAPLGFAVLIVLIIVVLLFLSVCVVCLPNTELVVWSLGPETVNYVVGCGDFNVPILLKHTLCAETGVSSSYKKYLFSQIYLV